MSDISLFGRVPDVDDQNVKIAQDRYEVYVNGEFVGKKVLLTQTDDIQDLESFLHNKGFANFTAAVDGDHFTISVPDDSAHPIKETLQVYLDTR